MTFLVAAHYAEQDGAKIELANADPYQGYLLPDLIISAPTELFIENQAGRRQLRFNTTFINQGEGVFEVRGDFDYERELTHATQHLFAANGDKLEKAVGTFVFHPDHDHWHIGEYVVFQLWAVTDHDQPTRLVASTDKMSFCIWDRDEHDLTLPNAPQERVYDLCENEIQGLSVGWADTYRANIEGQELDVTEIPDGRYLVRSEINPDRTMVESNYENNAVELLVELDDMSLRVVQN